MMVHQSDDQRRDVFSQRMAVSRVVSNVYLADAGDLCCGSGNAVDALTSDDQMHFAAHITSGGNRTKRRVLDRAAFMFDPNERFHIRRLLGL